MIQDLLSLVLQQDVTDALFGRSSGECTTCGRCSLCTPREGREVVVSASVKM